MGHFDKAPGLTPEGIDQFMSVLMNNYLINANDIDYEILEAEFYYHSQKHNDTSVFPRNKNSDEIYFHGYGFDICFQTINNEEKYGGVLIRSIKAINNGEINCEPICGPINVQLKILESVKKEKDYSVLKMYLKKCEKMESLIQKSVRIKGIQGDGFDEKLYRYIKLSLKQILDQRNASDYYRKKTDKIQLYDVVYKASA